MTPAPLLLITDDARSGAMLAHAHAPDHPECPERLLAIRRALASLPAERVARVSPDMATRSHLLLAHSQRHVDALLAQRGKPLFIDEDTAGNEHTIDAALFAAGAGVRMIEALMSGEAQRCMALVRPPGHHAEHDRAMGFCYFNNIAIAAAHAVAAHAVSRVLIVDWDVHHGNGTQNIFEHRSDVLVFNVHEQGNYPGTGSADEIGIGGGAGFTINVPLPPASDDERYIHAFQSVLVPAAERFRPELVLVSAGFDAHLRDPLGNMRVSERGFASMCAIVRDVAAVHAGGRLGFMLEGGYDLESLAQSVLACGRVLLDLPDDQPPEAIATPQSL